MLGQRLCFFVRGYRPLTINFASHSSCTNSHKQDSNSFVYNSDSYLRSTDLDCNSDQTRSIKQQLQPLSSSCLQQLATPAARSRQSSLSAFSSFALSFLIRDCLCSRSWEMRSIVARGVNFGMAVAYMISAEQCATETVASMDISYSGICLDSPYFLRFAAPS